VPSTGGAAILGDVDRDGYADIGVGVEACT
jgi:hypothetical protein